MLPYKTWEWLAPTVLLTAWLVVPVVTVELFLSGVHNEVKQNTEFRIKYPRGELGQSSQDIEQFMLIEDIYKTIERLQADIDENADNKINIEFMKEQLDKALTNIEKLKDADRDIKYTNGTGGL